MQAPTKFRTVVSMKAAKAIGLNVPPSLLVLADEGSNKPADFRSWHLASVIAVSSARSGVGRNPEMAGARPKCRD